MFLILVYDVGEKRVQKVHKMTKRYLNWIQNSVFEGELSDSQFKDLKNHIRNLIDPRVDSVIYYQMKDKYLVKRSFSGVLKNDDSIVV